MIAHTATPWHVGPHYKSDVESRHGRVAECGVARGEQAAADAAFIVKAANCHDDLLQALREVEGDCYYLPNPGEVARCGMCQQAEGEPHEPECTMNFVLAAIAKAEGRPA